MEKTVEGLEGLPVMESFYTIQGEGYYQGSAAYFVRLGGCDVGCHWCDVKESWDVSAHPKMDESVIVNNVIESRSPLAVITGGEPLMHNLDSLTGKLKSSGIKTNVETSGAYALSGDWDWVCLSPKKFKAPLQEVIDAANELKVVIYNSSDFRWAEEFAEKVAKNCKLYLQPEWSVQSKMIPLIIDYVKGNPKWEVSLQIHKFMNIP